MSQHVTHIGSSTDSVDEVYYASPSSVVPAGYVGYDFDLPNDFPGVIDSDNAWFYGTSGSHAYPAGSGWPATLTPTLSVTEIQAVLDERSVFLGLSPGAMIWVVNTDKTITLWYAPSIDPGVVGHMSDFWLGPNSNPNAYTGKVAPSIPTAHLPPMATLSCRRILLRSVFRVSPDRLEQRGFELDGTLIAPFYISNVLRDKATVQDRSVCVNTALGEVWNVIERTHVTPCGEITTRYFDPDVSPMVDVTLDVVSMRHAGQCDCCRDANTTPILQAIMSTRDSYLSGGLLGTRRTLAQSKFHAAGDTQQQIKIYKNGNVLYTSALSPVLTSMANAVAWVNANSAGLITINTFSHVDPLVGTVTPYNYTGPAPADPDEWLIVVTETATQPDASGDYLNNNMDYMFTNRGLSFGAPRDDATGGGAGVDWANRAGHYWQ